MIYYIYIEMKIEIRYSCAKIKNGHHVEEGFQTNQLIINLMI